MDKSASSSDAEPVRITPERLFVPLAFRETDTGRLLVGPGARVARGQALSEPADESAFVPLAPVPGRVVGRAVVRLAGGRLVASLQIDPDRAGETESPPPATTIRPTEPPDLPALFSGLRSAGIWAHRQTSPALLDQLAQAMRRPCDSIICCGLDADPRAAVNSDAIDRSADDIAAALEVLARCLRVRRCLLAIDSRQAIPATMRRSLRSARIRLAEMSGAYPLNDPTLLVRWLLRRRLRPGRLPTEQGALVLDALAAARIGAWLMRGEPMLDAEVLVHDAPRHRLHRIITPAGTRLDDVLSRVGLGAARADLFRGGDALREISAAPDTILTPGHEMLVHCGYAEAAVDPDPCIRCGWCVEACPTGVHPAAVLEAAQASDVPMAERHRMDSCIECGLCSYVCPSRLPLLRAIRQMRLRGRA